MGGSPAAVRGGWADMASPFKGASVSRLFLEWIEVAAVVFSAPGSSVEDREGGCVRGGV